jgi:di/tricarboxylate transporter
MSIAALITLGVLIFFLISTLSDKLAVDAALLIAIIVLLITGVLTPNEAFSGFSNPALYVISSFYVVSTAVKESGALHWWVSRCFGNSTSIFSLAPRVFAPIAFLSSVISNTPVVAIFIPQLQDWARRHRISPSKLMMPLSFAAIVGGTCTLIGTSTNILLLGLLQKTPEAEALNIFSPALVGVPLVLLALVYFIVFNRLLPERKGVEDIVADARKYAIAMQVDPNGNLDGKTILEAGLRHLKFAYLSEIHTGSRILPAVGPNEILHAGDILMFVGQPEAVSELRQVRGLRPAEKHVDKLKAPYSSRCLLEAVVSPTSSLSGKDIKASSFRTLFGGAILAVSRHGEKIDKKVGSIVLRPGDTLLIEAPIDFIKRHRYNRDFLLLNPLEESSLPDQKKAPLVLGFLLTFVVVALLDLIPLVSASLVLVAALIFSRCISLEAAYRNLDLRVLSTIGTSIALGLAVQNTGLAQLAANTIMTVADGNPMLNLILLYILAVVATELITNNAAVILMFPVATALSSQLGVSMMPFVMAIMFGASMSFVTPFGYQTNLMVQGPGGYHASDYVKFGGLMALLAAITVLTLVPIFWPFHS